MITVGFGRKKGERTLQREKSEDLEGKRWRWVQNPFMVLSHNQNREIETMLVLIISRYSITEVKRAKEGFKAVGASTKQPS